jgi:hypothetical protein
MFKIKPDEHAAGLRAKFASAFSDDPYNVPSQSLLSIVALVQGEDFAGERPHETDALGRGAGNVRVVLGVGHAMHRYAVSFHNVIIARACGATEASVSKRGSNRAGPLSTVVAT